MLVNFGELSTIYFGNKSLIVTEVTRNELVVKGAGQCIVLCGNELGIVGQILSLFSSLLMFFLQPIANWLHLPCLRSYKAFIRLLFCVKDSSTYPTPKHIFCSVMTAFIGVLPLVDRYREYFSSSGYMRLLHKQIYYSRDKFKSKETPLYPKLMEIIQYSRQDLNIITSSFRELPAILNITSDDLSGHLSTLLSILLRDTLTLL